MGLHDITREAVFAAVAEYDELGQDAFLARYGYGVARSYLLEHNGRQYDSKAIVGVAHGHLPGYESLRAADFSGGDRTVATHLRRLGFTVVSARAPIWLRDEVILACDLVAHNNWRRLEAHDPRVKDLSALLQRLPLHPIEARGPKFRNTNGVARKTVDIATQHPMHGGAATHGGAIDREVLQDFLDRPTEMHAAAQAIRKGIDSGLFNDLPGTLGDGSFDDAQAPEGRLLARRYFARERDPKLRQKKIRSFLAQHARIACEACAFDFEATYGTRGTNYIECHHAVPLHASGATTTRLADLVLLCSNCHRMIHQRHPWLTLNELHVIIRSNS